MISHLPYTSSFLNENRKITDTLADQAIASLFQDGEPTLFRSLIGELKQNDDVIPEHYPEAVKIYFEQAKQFPTWASPTKINQGLQFFSGHATEILAMLGLLSLPYCYAASDGVQVLYLSERIRNDTARRLLETGEFVFDVMAPNGFEPRGKGMMSCLKVRLIHAATRYFIAKSNKWNAAWGEPVNQEDMAGTNLAFSFIITRGLRKIGKTVSMDDTEAYLHLWNVIGYLMGIRQELLPANMKEAFQLDQMIAERHFRKSDEGMALTKSLINHFNQQFTLSAIPVTAFMRFLLGNKVADILGLPPSDVPNKVLQSTLWALGLQNLTGTTGYFNAKDQFRLQKKGIWQDNAINFHAPSKLGSS